MKILHLCLSSFYIDKYGYQENLLPMNNNNDGNDVLIIASCETFGKDNKLTYLSPCKYVNENNIPVIRLPYRKFLPHFIMKKLRFYPNVHKIISDFKPDSILFHGLSGFELITVSKYKKQNPNVRFYVDCHSDKNNSAQNFVSKNILHKLYYRFIIRYALPFIDKILYITPETKTFINEIYKVPDSKLEYFPLGGDIYSDEIYHKKREETRKKIGINKGEVLFVQTGKFDKKKKLVESISAFNKINSKKLKLVIIGKLSKNIEKEALTLIKENENIIFLGWEKTDELFNYLCAADIYLQPGSQSATMQNALCLRCPVILDDVPSHELFVKGNGWLLNNKTKLVDVLEEIAKNSILLQEKSIKSLEIAREYLDYKTLAKRLYN